MTSDIALLDMILRHESDEYVDDTVDRGRCSKFGITRATLQDWRGKLVTCDDVRQLTESEARQIYVAHYIRPFDWVDDAIKSQVVDIAVNSGVTRARALLALAQQGTKPVQTQLVIERLKHYARICKQDTAQVRFLSGWIARACEFL
jgi:lysozyme family protein